MTQSPLQKSGTLPDAYANFLPFYAFYNTRLLDVVLGQEDVSKT